MTDKELLEQFQLLAGMIQDSESRLRDEISQSETRISIKIENEITRRLDGLTDGYKTVHERQWELERKTESLEQALDAIKERLAVLENKTA